MKEACVQAVQDTLQRELGAGERKGIDDRVRKWMRLLARRDQEGWQGLSGTQRLDAAAKAAAHELMAEVSKARQQVSLQIAAWDRAENLLKDMPQNTLEDHLARLHMLGRQLTPDPAGIARGPRSIESSTKALREEMQGKLLGMWAAADPKFFGLFESREGIEQLIDEIHGGDTGNPTAKAGAKAWRKQMDEARNRYNAAGGHVGDLGEQYFPNHHDKEKVGNAGFAKWYKATEPELDKGKYLNNDGSNLSPKDLKEFFSHVFNTIITDGDSKSFRGPHQGEMVGPELLQQRTSGHGLFADRNSQHRQVFFKDGASFIRYQKQFGRQSFLSTALAHVNRFARDTSVLESQGPNAEQQFAALNNREAMAAQLKFPDAKSQRAIAKEKDLNESMWRFVSGSRDIVDSRVARFFQGYRNVMTGLRLDKVVFTALGDEAGMAATALANKVPYSEMLAHQLKMLPKADPAARSAVQSFGVGINSIIGSLNRLQSEDIGSGATAKFANTILRSTGAERLWDGRKQAVALTLMHQIGGLSRNVEHVTDLHEADVGMLARKGITDAEWQVYRRAGLNADDAVTPHEIWSVPDEKLKDLGDPLALKRSATTALMAHISEEAGMGVMETGARERARVAQYIDADENKVWGQIGRSVMLFKTFTSSMMMKHWERMGSMGTLGGKAMYGTILGIYGTAIAATVNAIVRPFIAGLNPPSIKDKRFWASAILRGGGLGYFGDFLYEQMNSKDQSLGAAAVGPTGTTMADIWNVTGAALIKKQKGERTDEKANLIKLARDNNPLLKTWYTQALWDHLLWYNLQEAANPGYLDRMTDRQQAYGRSYFWSPHDTLPSHGPDISKVVGQ